jgi:hypothetical protein
MEIKSYLYIDELFFNYFVQNLLYYGYKEVENRKKLFNGSFSILKFKSEEFVRVVSVLEREGHECESEEFTGDKSLAKVRIPSTKEIWREKLMNNRN